MSRLILIVSEGKGLLHWLQQHLLACPIKHTFGMDCPGCGMQRSLLALLQGDFAGSFQLHPALMPLLVLILFTMIHLKLDFKAGALIVKILFVTVVVFILINYIYKIYHHQLFN
jgi:hypothetical protein